MQPVTNRLSVSDTGRQTNKSTRARSPPGATIPRRSRLTTPDFRLRDPGGGKIRRARGLLIRARTSLPRSSGVKKYFGPDSPGVIH
jgi:hypothetical protein